MFIVFFFKQKTAYDMRISDWSSDVCSSDLFIAAPAASARNWPKDARNAAIAVLGLTRLAQQDAAAAEALLDTLAAPLALSAEQVTRVRYQLALWSAASYDPGAAKRLAGEIGRAHVCTPVTNAPPVCRLLR